MGKLSLLLPDKKAEREDAEIVLQYGHLKMKLKCYSEVQSMSSKEPLLVLYLRGDLAHVISFRKLFHCSSGSESVISCKFDKMKCCSPSTCALNPLQIFL